MQGFSPAFGTQKAPSKFLSKEWKNCMTGSFDDGKLPCILLIPVLQTEETYSILVNLIFLPLYPLFTQ